MALGIRTSLLGFPLLGSGDGVNKLRGAVPLEDPKLAPPSVWPPCLFLLHQATRAEAALQPGDLLGGLASSPQPSRVLSGEGAVNQGASLVHRLHRKADIINIPILSFKKKKSVSNAFFSLKSSSVFHYVKK